MSMEEGHYFIQNEGYIQGQIIGSGNTVNQHFYEPDISAQHSSPSVYVWNIPYLRNPLFTGREDQLSQLHENLTENKTTSLTQALSGLGGIGKTQTAIEYAYRYREEYHYVLWINAATHDTIITSVLELAAYLHLPQHQNQNQIVADVKAWFAVHGAWLLIFDNVEDLTLVEAFLPSGGKGHLLLTTRAQPPGTLGNAITVERMDMQEGMLLLLRRAGVLRQHMMLEQASAADRAAADAIVQEMGGLPLALDQAGAYIEETRCSVASYLELYRARPSRLLQRRGGSGTQHSEPVATTWSLSFERVESLDPLAADLLRVCAFLAPDALPEQLLLEGASELGKSFQSLVRDSSLLDEAVSTLLRFSLIKRERDEATLSVHRLVQTILRASMDTKTQRKWAQRAVRAALRTFTEGEDYRRWSHCQRLLPHAQVCIAWIDQWGFSFPTATEFLDKVSSYLFVRAQYSEAEPLIKRGIAIEERVFGPEHPNVAGWLTILALLYRKQGKYKEAELLCRRAVDMQEKALNPDLSALAASLSGLATLCYKLDKYEESESLYQQAITLQEKTFGPNHPDLAASLNNLAYLYSARGEFKAAERLIKRAIAIGKKLSGPDDPQQASRFAHLASLYVYQGRYKEAKQLYHRAITIGVRVWDSRHPDVVTYRENLANLQRRRTSRNPTNKLEQVSSSE